MSATPPPPPVPTMPAGHFVTDDDKTPLIEVFVWFMLSLSALTVTARVGTKLHQVGKLLTEDYLILAALAFALGQSIAVAKQCANGLGQHLKTLDADERDVVFKAGYAADILFLLSQGLAKISFMETGVPIVREQSAKSLRILQAVSLAWTISSMFVVFFQCSVSAPWDYLTKTCINRTGFWMYYSVFNLITDVASVIIMMESFLHIQVPLAKKALIMGVFGSRILTLPAIIVQLYYTNEGELSSRDPTFDLTPNAVTVQVVQCMGIFTACIPILKPFIDSLDSGHLGGDDMRRRGQSSNGYSSQQNASQNNRSSKAKGIKQLLSPTSSQLGGQREPKDFELSNLEQRGAAGTGHTVATAQHDANCSWDGQSATSQKGLIQMTRTWDVEIDRSKTSGLAVGDDNTEP